MDFKHQQNTVDMYDRFSGPPWNDIAFYRERLTKTDARVLELGCGTGRVLLPMAEHAVFVLGIDRSPDMLAVCNRKLQQASLPASRVQTTCADIANWQAKQRSI